MKQMKLNDFKVHVFALIVVAIVFIVYSLSNASDGIEQFRLALRVLGYSGIILISISFLLGTIRSFVPSLVKYLKYRKTIGLWGAFLAALHAINAMNFQFNWNFSVFFNPQNIFNFSVTLAAIAFVILLEMALTSTPAAVKKLGLKKWNFLHRIGYIALFLGVMHALYIPGSVLFSTKHGMLLVLLAAIALLLKAASVIKDIKKYPLF